LLYTWRRKFRRELSAPALAEAVLTDEPEPEMPEACSAIVIDLPGGGRVSISALAPPALAPPALAAAALKALR
jgi:transposase